MLTKEDLDNIRRIFREENTRKDAAAPKEKPAEVWHIDPATSSDRDCLIKHAQSVADAHGEDALVVAKPFPKAEATEHIPYIVLASQANTWEKDNAAAVVHPEKQS